MNRLFKGRYTTAKYIDYGVFIKFSTLGILAKSNKEDLIPELFVIPKIRRGILLYAKY